MRPFALIPILLSAGALIMAFLCLFAGNKGFMDDFDLLTLNMSRVGSSLADSVLSGDTDILPTELTNLLNSLPANVQATIESISSTAADSFATRIGLEDFYSAHIMNDCYGKYLPGPVPNATVSADDIYRHLDGCSKIRANYWFDPRVFLQQSLDRANVTTITVDSLLDQIGFPASITSGLNVLRVAYHAMFACYIITIVLSFIMLLTSALYIFSNGSRITACITMIVSVMTFLASGAASGVATAVNVIGASVINEKGNQYGIEAHQGRKFLALTWGCTAILLVGLLYWFVDCCCGRSRKEKSVKY
ncbi:integral membrane protein-like protein [Pleomassaria siparia CBS 279.74]|uniref:Integral membrane protein-like protein n=1 Tax=Pleomassaria siparia CBS 279.74 TaxID=1314801 RepID=A0A6G1JRS0_9PLEO|nr:integral membrane protein-like protein [Pleomassaria siparia CBS 279.74]